MKMIAIIAEREFKTLFLSPLAWTILAILQGILAFLFLTQLEVYSKIQAQLANMENGPSLTDVIVTPLYGNAAVIFLLVTPILTMRLVCEERRNKTLALLLSAPVSNTDIIIGKYLGNLGLLLVFVGIISLMPLSLLMGGMPDFGKLFSSLLALSLLISAFSAIGLYMSAIANHPIIAAMGTFGIVFILWILDWSAAMEDSPSGLFSYLSLLRHFQNLQTGLINSVDIIYFVLFNAGFLWLAIRRLDKDRLQQ
jgi:ABC-2 type transport system permease protein